jgi:hypothetical protein
MRKSLTIIAATAALLPVGVAQSHPGNAPSQLTAATRRCIGWFEGCALIGQTPGTHARGFLFTRQSHTKPSQSCIQHIVVTHDDKVTIDRVLGCTTRARALLLSGRYRVRAGKVVRAVNQ